jgi:hypothetical protein
MPLTADSDQSVIVTINGFVTFIHAYASDGKNTSRMHEYAIAILSALNTLNAPLPETTLEKLAKLLEFRQISTKTPNDLLVCALAGIDIKQVVARFISSNVLLQLPVEQVTGIHLAVEVFRDRSRKKSSAHDYDMILASLQQILETSQRAALYYCNAWVF